MGKLRNAVDKSFEALGRVIVRFRWLVVVITVLLSIFMASRLPYLTFDMSTEAFLREDDPSIQRYNEYRDQFGRDEMIVIMVKPENVFDLQFLEKLQRLHEELEENVPYLNDITSLVNARLTRGAEGELIVQDLLEEFPTDTEELAQLKQTVLSNPLYVNLLISEDGSLTTLVIKSDAYSSIGEEEVAGTGMFEVEQEGADASLERKVLSNEENSQMVAKIREIMDNYNSADFPLYLSGSPVVTDYLKKTMQHDMMRFTRLAILSIGIFLFILFRRLSGVFFPLVTVSLSVIYTLSLMATFDVAIKLPLVILPSFLLAIGVGASVHLMSIFFKYYREGNKESAISSALGHSGMPIAMTSITTATGLASFAQAELAPAADLGIFAAMGVLVSLMFTVFLIPALIAIFPIKPILKEKQEAKKRLMDRWLIACGDFAVDNKVLVALLSAGIICFGIIGILKLELTHHVLYWFPVGSEIRENTELIDDKMKGTLALEIVIDTKEENGLYDPDLLNKIEELSRRLEAYDSNLKGVLVGKTISLVDLVKELNKAMNENRATHYTIPDNRTLIAQELLLYENSGADDLEDLVDNQFSKTHITVKMPWKDSVSYVALYNFLQKNADELFDDDDVEITVTGIIEMMMMTIHAMMQSTIKSYTIAAVIITLLMILLIGNFRIGVLSMIPNLTPIILTLGMMGWVGINLDMFTMLIGSIAIGLAVDDTIHFFHNFRKYHDQTGSTKLAVQKTLTTAGRAMLVTTLVLATGFWLFMFATMQNLFYFGLLTGVTLVFAFLADVIIAPALVALVTKDRVTAAELEKDSSFIPEVPKK